MIEFITDSLQIENPIPSEYWSLISQKLDNPYFIWRNALTVQSSESVQDLVKLVCFAGGKISEDSLNKYFLTYQNLSGKKNPNYRQASEIASRSFLIRNSEENNIYYTLLNPSILDFVVRHYNYDVDDLKYIFLSIPNVSALVGRANH